MPRFNEVPLEETPAAVAPRFQGEPVPEPGEKRYGGFREGVLAFTGSALEGVPIVGPALRAGGERLAAAKRSVLDDTSFEDALMDVQGRQERVVDERPGTALAGALTGATVPFLAAGATGLGGKMLGVTGKSMGARMAAGGATTAAVGAADAGVRTDGDLDAMLIGGGIGGLAGALAPPIGQMGGEIVERVINGFRAKPKVPTTTDLKTTKEAAYQAVDNSGVKYTPQAFQQLTADTQKNLAAANVNATRHPKAVTMAQDLADLAAKGQSLSITKLDQLRQVVARDVASSADQAERFFGKNMIDTIDDFIANADQNAVIAGDPATAAAAIKEARAANARYRKAEMIDEAQIKGKRRAESTGAGGNVDNAQRQEIRKILDSPRKSRGLTDEEKMIMELVVQGTPLQNTARLVGKMSPSGNGLMFGLGAGAAMTDPRLIALPALGALAKGAEGRLAAGNLEMLDGVVKGGLPAPSIKSQSFDEMMEAIMRGTASQLGPRK